MDMATSKVINKRFRRYECFTHEQQKAYEALTDKQRLYVDNRGKGYNKVNSYRMAGYDSRVPAQAAYIMEKDNKVVGELVKVLINSFKAESLIDDPTSPLNQTVDALAAQEGAEQVIKKVEGADSETAKRIQFYRDILNGKIKTVKKIKRFNAHGALLDQRVEEYNDVEVKMRARKELDRILGLNEVIDLDKLQFGGITVNIVDASKREEADDPRNKINIDPSNIQEVEGEAVAVAEEISETVKDDADAEGGGSVE